MQGWTLAAALAAILASGPLRAAGEGPAPLSAEASRGYVDIELTRLAIFDGRVADAKRLIHEAADAFEAAKGDASVFQMAEGELHAATMNRPPAETTKAEATEPAGGRSPAEIEAETAAMNRAKQENSAKVYTGGAPNDAAAAAANRAAEERAAAAANAAKQEATAKAWATGTPIRWLPVEVEMNLETSAAADPAKAAALATADAALGAGDRAGALAALQKAGVHINPMMAILPLDQTLADVRKAASLVDAGRYYEASLLLRQLQSTTRYTMMHM